MGRGSAMMDAEKTLMQRKAKRIRARGAIDCDGNRENGEKVQGRASSDGELNVFLAEDNG
jgi:hypothetical protein